MFHGSSDRRPQVAATVLAQLFTERMQHTTTLLPFARHPLVSSRHVSSETPSINVLSDLEPVGVSPGDNQISVGVASLECAPIPLQEQIIQFVGPLAGSNESPLRLFILPLFLLKGIHVMADIPAAVVQAQQSLGELVQINTRSPLGTHPGLYRLMTERMARLPVEAWILCSHGSRRLEANQAIDQLAARLGAVTAYWSVPPDLESRIHELMAVGIRRIGIFPYFLFSGKTTDAIAQLVDRLSHQFPTLHLHLTPPLDASPELADLVVDLAEDRVREF